jgi:hypothetical protein
MAGGAAINSPGRFAAVPGGGVGSAFGFLQPGAFLTYLEMIHR